MKALFHNEAMAQVGPLDALTACFAADPHTAVLGSVVEFVLDVS